MNFNFNKVAIITLGAITVANSVAITAPFLYAQSEKILSQVPLKLSDAELLVFGACLDDKFKSEAYMSNDGSFIKLCHDFSKTYKKQVKELDACHLSNDENCIDDVEEKATNRYTQDYKKVFPYDGIYINLSAYIETYDLFNVSESENDNKSENKSENENESDESAGFLTTTANKFKAQVTIPIYKKLTI